MKSLALALLLAFTASANASQTTVNPIVAQMVVSIGFRPPESPREVVISISARGNVVETSTYDDGRAEKIALLKLGPAIMKQLTTNIAAVVPGEVVDPNPDMPSCMDAPYIKYEIVSSNGTTSKLAERIACKELYKAGNPQADAQIVNLLETLSTLSRQK